MCVQFDSVWKRKFFLRVQKSERLKDKCKAAVFSLKSCLSWQIPVSKNPGGDSKLFFFFILFTINLSSVQGWPQTTREGLLNKCATAMVTARVLCANAICRFIENEQLRQDFQLYSIISVLSFAILIVFLKTWSRPRRANQKFPWEESSARAFYDFGRSVQTTTWSHQNLRVSRTETWQ